MTIIKKIYHLAEGTLEFW